jgi:hypothetical protein
MRPGLARAVVLFAGVVGVGLGAGARGQGEGLLCAARDIVSRTETPGDAAGVALAGDLAYIADGAGGLLIVSVAAPGEPLVVGSVGTAGTARRVAVVGSYALVASGSAGLQVVDVSEPSAPVVVTGLSVGASVHDLVVRGGLAYLGTGSGLAVVDVADPADPSVVGALTTPGGGTGVAVDGPVAYLSGGSAGLRVIDVGDPGAPVLRSTYDPGTVVDAVAALGMAYVAHAGGLTVLDVTDPEEPRIVSEFDAFWAADHDIALAGSRLYVDGGKAVIDMTDPAEPALVGQCLVVGAHAVVRSGLSFCAGAEGLEIVDVGAPPETGLLAWLTAREAEGVEIVGNYALLAERQAGLGIVDISDPAYPVRVATIMTGGFSADVAVEGHVAFVADATYGTGGVRAIDISDPANPVLLNGPNDWRGDRIAVENGVVGLMGGTLRFIDFSNPSSPQLVGQHAGASGSHRGHIHMEGGLAYTAGNSGSGPAFRIFDVSRPADGPIGGFADTGRSLGVDTGRGLACLTVTGGLGVADITDPAAPLLLGTIAIPLGQPEAIAIFGEYALASFSYGPVWLIDLRDPTNPRHAASLDAWVNFSPTVWDIAVQGETAYVVKSVSGLYVFDLSDCSACPADFNADGSVNTQDFLAFLTAWAGQRGEDCSGGGCSADLNVDGQVTTQDFVEFLNLWAAGC